MTRPDWQNARRRPSLAQLERDAALKRVARTRGWMIAVGAALTAALAAAVSAIAPGRTLAARPARNGASARTATNTPISVKQMPPLASPNALGLQSPSSVPQAPTEQSQPAPAPSQPAAPAAAPSGGGGGAVVSGGS